MPGRESPAVSKTVTGARGQRSSLERPHQKAAAWTQISPSSMLLKFAGKISASGEALTLDVACGLGRNAVALAAHGYDVVCLDRDLSKLRQLGISEKSLLHTAPLTREPGSIIAVCAAVSRDVWPFPAESFDAIISVHFVMAELFSRFSVSLRRKGYLYIETFGGQGRNFLDLPEPGEIRAALDGLFTIIYYR